MAVRPGSILSEKYKVFSPVTTVDGHDRFFASNLDGRPGFLLVKVNSPIDRDVFTALSNQLNNPFLAKVIDQFSIPEIANFIVYEVGAGKPLSDRIGQGEPSPYNEVIPLLLNLCDALSELHNMHPPRIPESVMPENIFVSPDGKPILIYTGFGGELDRKDVVVEAKSVIEGLARTGIFLLIGQMTIPAEMRGSDGALYFHEKYPDVPLSICSALVSGLRTTAEPGFSTFEEFKNSLLLALIQIPAETLRLKPIELADKALNPDASELPIEPPASLTPVIEPSTPIRRRVPWGFI